jgi:menaquinone-specific isochorismate synthase
MSLTRTQDNQLDWEFVARQLLEALHDYNRPSETLHRIELPIQPCDIMLWAVQQTHDEKLYWSDRNGAVEVAGIGEALVLSPSNPDTLDIGDIFDYGRKVLSSRHKHQRLYGGFSFADSTSEQWKPFGRYRFIAPSIEVGRDGDDYYAACQWRGNDEQKRALETLLKSTHLSDSASPTHIAQERVDTPTRVKWMENIERLLDLFEQGKVDKVVMARESKFLFNTPVDAFSLLKHLRDNTMRSYHYAFQAPQQSTFIGASPERLFKRDGELLYSEALAATRPRGTTLQEDDALAHSLLTSEKDHHEHQLVLDRIMILLGEFCSSISRDRGTEVLKLRHCQHLLCKVGGQLNHGDCDAEVLAKLHPTPAVGGTPKEEALHWIAELENFDRGWYAAPVGWISHDAVEFAVAIRSALVQGETVSVYTGAGIVPGSKPKAEWNEIENKMSEFRALFSPEG